MKKLLLLSLNLFLIIAANAQCNVHFVATTGSASGAGTMADPLDLATAFIVAGDGDIIRIGNGTYTLDAALTIPADNIVIEGGFLPLEGWKKTSMVGTTTLSRSALNPEGSANNQRIVALYGVSRIGFQIHDITITTANASTAGTTTYGIHLSDCSEYSIVRCNISAGNGGAGANGAPGAPGAVGTVGGPGQDGSIDGNCSGGTGGNGGAGGGVGAGTAVSGGVNVAGCDNSGTAGTNGIASSNYRAGGSGGSGASGGETNHNAAAGGLGGGVNGGAPQLGAGSAGTWGDPGGDGGNGTIGANGIAGSNGLVATAGLLNLYYTPSQGTSGSDGQGGKGGAGGGGGGGQSCTFCDDGSGDGGGGGGGGGQGGQGGQGGYSGGGSFGIYLYNNGINGTILDSYIITGTAGSAGTGGIAGSGSLGGVGGLGSTFGSSEVGTGGNGGKGGDGGAGGAGGNGLAGIANAVKLASGIVLNNTISNFNLAAQPEIKVEYGSCTNTDMSFEALSLAVGTGTAAWDFGLNATSTTFLDNPGTANYAATGYKNIMQGVDVYTGFVYISCLGYNQTANVTICQGESVAVGPYVHSTAGTFTDVLTSVVSGCDSTITTTIAINPVNVATTQNNEMLSANQSGETYQWINCGTGNSIIAGATSQSYTATQLGNYAVIVTIGSTGCSDTSSCLPVTGFSGIQENHYFDNVRVYPNPSNGNFTIDFGKEMTATIVITDVTGKVLQSKNMMNTDNLHFAINETSGIYFLNIQTENGQKTIRLIKE